MLSPSRWLDRLEQVECLSLEGRHVQAIANWILLYSKCGLAVCQKTVRIVGLQVGRPTRLNAEEAEELEAQWRDFGALDK